ncbi:MAG: LmbE family N-acetylglucosaminyl deacetylase [Planctomycetota bacterium]|jgi:LmbE family N-acetylglucosaminyl deacetylase
MQPRPKASARPSLLLLVLLCLGACAAPEQPDYLRHNLAERPNPEGPEVLVVVAHPDDEILFAGLLYKLYTHLDGAADVVVITNGEGGFKYSTLVRLRGGLDLTDQVQGRRILPDMRRREMRESCKVLQVRDLLFLGQQDHRYTQDVGEILGPDAEVWDQDQVRRVLRNQLKKHDYDFVLLLAPTTETHGHHQAATFLTLEVLAELEQHERPIALCARSASEETPRPEAPAARPNFPLSQLRPGAPIRVFDRTQSFGHKNRLDYRIIANWAIAEHKTQGTMQLLMNHALQEHYFLFDLSPQDAGEELDTLFARLAEDQFPVREYDASAGTNATK